MRIVDTHCHLYLEEFKNDIGGVIERAIKTGVEKFYLPCIDSSVISDMMALESNFTGMCMSMMGLHPCSVKENYREELDLVKDWLLQRKFAAVGEIGLDFYWDRTFERQQLEAFHQQIAWALQFNLPVVIHSRNSTRECIDIVRKYILNGLKGIFHCFGGSYQEAAELSEMGFFLGIGGVLTYKNSGLQEVLERIPLDCMVLETDSPYLSPVPFRGKRNESSYLKYIVEKLALVKGVSVEDVAAITTANAEKIFGS